jgi:biofilm protein TabA
MILGTLTDATRYTTFAPRLASGFEFLRTFDAATPEGRYPLDGDHAFALVSRYETGPATGKRFEAHRRYADLQYVAAGVERILHAPAADLETGTAYDEATDLVFFHDPPYSSSLLLPAGSFAVFLPGDAHKPGCMAGGRDAVVKVVVKLRIG